MKALLFLVLLAALAYAGWPYVSLYRLDRALMGNDQAALAKLVDLNAIKAQQKARLERQLQRSMGQQTGPIPDILSSGARWLGDQSVNAIDLDWVREQLRWRRPTAPDAYPSIISDMTFAFFESPTMFLIRIGDLGEEPIHVRMRMESWMWRVTAIYN